MVEQDYLRRILLRERDVDGGVAPALIAHTVRFALDHGYHVVLEGILARSRYGAILMDLCRAHRGRTAAFYLDIPWEETLRRHASRPQAAEFGEAEMREWLRLRTRTLPTNGAFVGTYPTNAPFVGSKRSGA
jgi:predicted kinase